MLAKVRKTIEKYGMLRKGEHVLVGVSGGADSVALLSVLRRLSPLYRLSLTAAHFNHGTRSSESDRDESFVRSLCGSMAIELVCGSRRSKASPRGLSMEDYLRRERYAFFDEACRRSGAGLVALGHHQGDQAETILMNILRGTGLSGLSGIPPVRDSRFIRPLIDCTRGEILDYLASEDLPFVDDSTNTDERFLRNRIRIRLLPELETGYNPNMREALCRLADVVRLENEHMTLQAQTHAARWGPGADPGRPFEVPIAKLRVLHPALQRRVILEMARIASATDSAIGFDHVQAVMDLAAGTKPGGSLNLPGGLLVRKRCGRLEFCLLQREAARSIKRSPPEGSRESFLLVVTVPSTVRIASLGVSLRFRELKRAPAKLVTDRRVYMDRDRIVFPLTVRSVRPGDRMQPLGMKGTRKLKSLFIDDKIPREIRGRIPVVADALSILWVPGVRLSERVRIGKETKRVLSAEMI